MNQKSKEEQIQSALTEYFEERVSISHNGLNIKEVEKLYNAKYIGEFALPTKTGWSERPADCFYCAEPDINKGHGSYFALIKQHSLISTPEKPDFKVMITSAEFLKDKVLTGAYLFIEDGVFCAVQYSTFRNDYQQKEYTFSARKEGCYEIMIDGGFDYLKTNTRDLFQFKFIDGNPVFLKYLNYDTI